MKTRTKNRNERDTYFELVKEFPLVSIRNARQLSAAQKFMGRLLQKSPLDAGEDEYLDALSDLVAIYEDSHDEFPSVSVGELLAHLIEAKGVKQSDVSRVTEIPRSTISEVLSGKRKIAMNHIGRLAKYFSVPPSVFLTQDVITDG